MRIIIAKRAVAVIAAAGMSTRIKRFKPLLPLGDKTVIEHIVEKYSKIDVDRILIITGRNAKEVENALDNTKSVEFVFNNDYETTSMFESVKLGFQRIRGSCEGVFFQPADMPLVSVETLNKLLNAMNTQGACNADMQSASAINTQCACNVGIQSASVMNTQGTRKMNTQDAYKNDARDTDLYDTCYEMVAPVFGNKRGHPILLSSTIIDAIMEYSGEGGLRGAIDKVIQKIAYVPVHDEGILSDIDTEEDYRRITALFNAR